MTAAPTTTKSSKLGTWIIGAAGLVSALTYSFVAIRSHRGFGTTGFDLGIYDQATWLISEGKQFMTMRGMNVWGHHNNAILAIFAVAYRLGGGPEVLIAVEAFTLALGSLPVFWIARARSNSEKIGILFGIAFLLYPPISWLSFWTFHPESLSITPLLFCWWFASNGKVKSALVSAFVAILTREEVGLVVVMMGVTLIVLPLFRGLLKNRSDRSAGVDSDGVGLRSLLLRPLPLALLLLGGLWFGVSSKYVIPHFNDGGDPYYVKRFYGGIGDTQSEVLKNILTNPSHIVNALGRSDAQSLAMDLFSPLGFLSILGAPLLLISSPQGLAVLLGNAPFIRDIRFQYTALMVPGIVLAAIEGFVFLTRRFPRALRPLVGWMLLMMTIGSFMRSPIPIGINGDQWAPNQRASVMREALTNVPDKASVSASDNLAPHLTHREEIFQFPNPFKPWYYGPDNLLRADPNAVDWVVLDLAQISKNDAKFGEALLRSPAFTVVFEKRSVIVAKRNRSVTLPLELIERFEPIMQ